MTQAIVSQARVSKINIFNYSKPTGLFLQFAIRVRTSGEEEMGIRRYN
jgi:hypothetical protein